MNTSYTQRDSEGFAVMQQQTFRASRKDSIAILQCFPSETEKLWICTSCRLPLLESERNLRDDADHQTGFFCCGNGGSRRHVPWPQVPEQMKMIMKSPRFPVLSRALNSLFSPVVMYSKDAEGYTYRAAGGPPILRVCGQMYGHLKKNPSACWFVHDIHFGSHYADLVNGKNRAFVHTVCSILRSHNRMSAALLDPTTNSFPTSDVIREGSIVAVNMSDELSLMYVGPFDAAPERQCAVFGGGQTLTDIDPLWELLGYPLFHPAGVLSVCWRPNMRPLSPTMTSSSRRKHKPKASRNLTLLAYMRSVMMHEPNFWMASRLAQQFVLDCWSRYEQHNMKRWLHPQFQERLRTYVTAARGTAPAAGKVFLPAGVPGCPLQLQKFFHDALHISATLGNPHLFLTFTANPYWDEIKQMCRPGEDPNARLDLIARVFVAKRKKLFKLLSQPNFLFDGHLGIQWHLWVVEWQQGGLPHIHAAVRLRIDPLIPSKTSYDQLSLLDRVVSAKMPDASQDNLAHHLVNAYMIHKPCSPKTCMVRRKDGTIGCRFYWEAKRPSPFSRIDQRGFPIYQRGPDDLRVVPHNAKLLKILRCHCNVEWTLNSQCIAYEYKYFTKGRCVNGVKISDAVNEIAAWKNLHVVQASESVYRTLGFAMHFRDPTVIVCKITLPRSSLSEGEVAQNFFDELDIPAGVLSDDDGHQDDADILEAVAQDCIAMTIYDTVNADEEHLDLSTAIFAEEFVSDGDDEDGEDHYSDTLDATQSANPQLAQYFERPEVAEELTYTNFFTNYVRVNDHEVRQSVVFPDFRGRKWRRRFNVVLARMPWVSPFHGEIYYLRTLLHAYPARSIAELKGGYSSFAAREYGEGLVTSDRSVLAMRDAVRSSILCLRVFKNSVVIFCAL